MKDEERLNNIVMPLILLIAGDDFKKNAIL